MIDNKDFVAVLHKISKQAESLACHSCAIIRAARKRLEEPAASPWISVDDRLPEDEQDVLVIASGRPREHLILDNAYELATFYDGEGWLLKAYPEWENPQVTYWMPLPERPKEGKNKNDA